MDDNSSNQNNISLMKIFALSGPKSGQEKLSVLARGLNKLIQYRNFIQNKRLQICLSDSGKKGVTINVHRACQKTITNEMKRSVKGILFQ